GGAAGEHVGDAGADLTPIDGRPALLVLEHARRRLGDRIGERDVLGSELGIPPHGAQEEHSRGAALDEHRQRHRRLHLDLDPLLRPAPANRFEEGVLVNVRNEDGSLGRSASWASLRSWRRRRSASMRARSSPKCTGLAIASCAPAWSASATASAPPSATRTITGAPPKRAAVARSRTASASPASLAP